VRGGIPRIKIRLVCLPKLINKYLDIISLSFWQREKKVKVSTAWPWTLTFVKNSQGLALIGNNSKVGEMNLIE